MVTLVLLLVAMGAIAASAVAASHSPLPVEQALPVGVLGLAWRNAGTRQTRFGQRTLWLADAPDRDVARYSRAYSAGRDALREAGFSWDSLTPVCWEAVPAPAEDDVLAAVAVAEAAADAVDAVREQARVEAIRAADREWIANGAPRAEAIAALRECLETKSWAWNKRKKTLAESLLGDRPSVRDAVLARELVGEVELLIENVTARLEALMESPWWERAGIEAVRVAVHEGCRFLSDRDEDRAAHRNGIGWSAAHSHVGHVLASMESLDQAKAAHALQAVYPHRRQLTPELRAGIFGTEAV
ncbi:hypothetical protein ASF60_18105 [Methylobacterium sp. Leaf113]|uniref:hypothetical protein n=1 Tax=Methylobacterium sp. Leaf113 TaxID=1736259 RepID=UPI0006F62C8D|nr:hypothetical protein [Methylobacterium sp. Leaf113]KQP91357.1 hypothetical protein ASF60_18105 [Methylobacterium sp. Leaf113]